VEKESHLCGNFVTSPKAPGSPLARASLVWLVCVGSASDERCGVRAPDARERPLIGRARRPGPESSLPSLPPRSDLSRHGRWIPWSRPRRAALQSAAITTASERAREQAPPEQLADVVTRPPVRDRIRRDVPDALRNRSACRGERARRTPASGRRALPIADVRVRLEPRHTTRSSLADPTQTEPGTTTRARAAEPGPFGDVTSCRKDDSLSTDCGGAPRRCPRICVL